MRGGDLIPPFLSSYKYLRCQLMAENEAVREFTPVYCRFGVNKNLFFTIILFLSHWKHQPRFIIDLFYVQITSLGASER